MYETMSTKHDPSLRDELCSYNSHLERRLRRWHMSLRIFKIVKSFTQLIGAASGIYAMHLGADPLTTFALVAFIVSGPEESEGGEPLCCDCSTTDS